METSYLDKYFKFGNHDPINRIGGTGAHLEVLRKLINDMQDLGMEIVYDEIRKCMWHA